MTFQNVVEIADRLLEAIHRLAALASERDFHESLQLEAKLLRIELRSIPDEAPALNVLWVRGGYPDSYLAETDEHSYHLRKDFIRT